MHTFEWMIGLLLGALLLSALARRVGVPYPTFLALGGIGLAFLPNSPAWTLEPDIALAIFVAPVLLDAAFDTSLRDLRRNWLPITTLVVVAVGVTTAAVAVVARWLVPEMPWAAAIALGAIVAPPDAAAATAILRTVKLPYRILKILEGENSTQRRQRIADLSRRGGCCDGVISQREPHRADPRRRGAGQHRRRICLRAGVDGDWYPHP